MSYYYVCIIKDGITPYSEKEEILRAYMNDIHKEDNPIIYKVDDEGLRKIEGKYFTDLVTEQFPDMYFTESELEDISSTAECDCEFIAGVLKRLKCFLKSCDTPASKELLKSLKKFEKEPVECIDDVNEDALDEFDLVDRLFEKIDYKKYSKEYFKAMRKFDKEAKKSKKKEG